MRNHHLVRSVRVCALMLKNKPLRNEVLSLYSDMNTIVCPTKVLSQIRGYLVSNMFLEHVLYPMTFFFVVVQTTLAGIRF